MTVLFWIVAILLAYCYVGYGLLIIILGGLFAPRGRSAPPARPMKVSLLIAAHNEAADIADKLENAFSLELGPHLLDIVVASDGSTDGTPDIVRGFADRGVRLLEVKEHRGKMFVLNAGLEMIDADVVVFSDANSTFRKDAIVNLLRHFGDPEVGGVCGRLTVAKKQRTALGRGEALYWTYDHAQKIAESRLSSAVTAQGSLYAVRRELLSPLPPAVADDLMNSLRVIAGGKRLVFEPEAVTEEDVSGSALKEFGRRVRSTERGVRGLFMMRELLNPFRYGFYSLQLFSHKVLRRLAPGLLVLFLVLSLSLALDHPFYATVAMLQLLGYAVVGLALAVPPLRGVSLVTFPMFFVLGHAAMGLGLLKFLFGQPTERWRPVRT